MRGAKVETQGLFSYVSPEQRVPQDHPLRAIRAIVERSLAEMDSHFSTMYSSYGRPSIPPEFLLRALLLQVFYSIRSERQLMEQLNYNLLFRWFVGLGMDDEVWVPTVFTKNRDRLLDHGTVREFFRSVLEQARGQNLLSEEHFSVDGTLLEAWASQKSFQPKDPEDRSGDGSDFRGQERSNETHASVTDPDARLYKKAPGEASRLAYLGHVLMDNRHGLIAGEQVTTADGTAEVDAATQLVDDLGGNQRITLGADKGYDRHGFVQDLRDRNVTPHVARKRKGSAIDARTTRHRGYAMSIHVRRRIESIFGWMKTVGGMRKTRFRGLERVGLHRIAPRRFYGFFPHPPKEIEIYKASVLDQTYPFSANGNSIATHEHTGCHYYGPYVSLSEGRYRARYELEIVSGSVEFIYADVCTQQAESIEKSEFFVKNDGDKITVDIHFEFSSRKDKVEVRVLSSASTSLKLSGFSIFKKAPEYAESFVFVIKSYSKDLDWAYYNFLSCEKYTAPRANFYIVVPEKEVALFTDRFLRGMRDNEIRSLPFILSEEYIFQKTDQSIPEEFDGWHIQQVVKLCFSKTKIAKNYCTLDSAMIFTKAFDWENELFVGEQIVTTARRHDRKERNDFLLSIDEKGWLHGELVNISESFEYIEKSFKNESDITHHYIAGNGFFSSELLLELNTWSGDRGFTGLISAAPYEFAWYGSFVANRRKDVFFSRDPLIMFPVIDVESATRITEPPLNVPENFFGLLFQPPAINYISPKKIYDLYVK